MPGASTHGVVIGGGLTGLLAARVLATHLHRVTLIDREALPRLPEIVPGREPSVSPHVHVARGLGSLETLLPGLTSELVTSGAVLLDAARDIVRSPARAPIAGSRFVEGLSARGTEHGTTIIACSRELVEWHVRRRISLLPNVHLLEGVEVVGLGTTDRQHRVTGVRVRSRRDGAPDPADATTTDFAADFVVDAGGHRSGAREWLRALGYPVPPIETRECVGWTATATFRPARPTAGCYAARACDDQAIDVRITTPFDLRALLLPIERGRVMLTLHGVSPSAHVPNDVRNGPSTYRPNPMAFASAMPIDWDGVLRLAYAIGHPALSEVLHRADPVGSVVVRREYAQPAQTCDLPGAWPSGFVAFGAPSLPDLGDLSTMMRVTLAAQALDRLLAARSREDARDEFVGLSAAFQRTLARLAEAAPRRITLPEPARATTTPLVMSA